MKDRTSDIKKEFKGSSFPTSSFSVVGIGVAAVAEDDFAKGRTTASIIVVAAIHFRNEIPVTFIVDSFWEG
jgi:hypothetical protein